MADRDATRDFPLLLKSKDVSAGLNTYIYPTEIADNEVQELTNFTTDTPGLVSKLEGTSVFSESDNASPVLGVVDFNPDSGASRVFMKAEVGEIYSINSSGTSTLRATVSTSGSETAFVQGLNKVYACNGSDFPVVFDTALSASHLASAVSMPSKFTTAEYFLNRLWVNDTDNPSYVHYSNTLSDAFDTTAQTFKFGEGAGDSEVVRVQGFRNQEMLVFMRRRIEQIIVTDPTDDSTWTRRVIDDRYGLAARDTVQEIGGVIYFLDNELRVRAMNRTALDANKGTQAIPISQKIDPELQRINKLNSSKCVSGVYKDFYVLAVPLDSATENDTVYAYDVTKGSWDGPWEWEAARFLTSKLRGNGDEELFWFGSDNSRSMRTFDGTYTASGASYSSVCITKKYDLGKPESEKTWGEFEVAVLGSGEGTLTVEARVDQADFQSISDKSGILNLVSGAPALPVDLPFNLGSTGIVRGKFQLEEFSRGRNIDFRMTHDGQGDCQILEWILTAFDENYESENP